MKTYWKKLTEKYDYALKKRQNYETSSNCVRRLIHNPGFDNVGRSTHDGADQSAKLKKTNVLKYFTTNGKLTTCRYQLLIIWIKYNTFIDLIIAMLTS